MSCLLALDLATTTGWAVAMPPYAPAPTPMEQEAGAAMPKRFSGSKSFKAYAGNIGRVMDQFGIWLPELITVHQPDMIVFEAPFAGAVRNANTGRMLFGFCAMVEMIAYRQKIRCLECNNATVKKHATGSGRAQKVDMIKAARDRGWEPKDDNAADALWLADYAAAMRQARAA